MKVRINGTEKVICAKAMTLQELVISRGLSPEKVVIEVNLRIVPPGTMAADQLAGQRFY